LHVCQNLKEIIKKKEEIFKKVPSYLDHDEIKSQDDGIQRKTGDSCSDFILNNNQYICVKRPSAPNKIINNGISPKDNDDDGGGCDIF
jgi:hypothetical protein